MFSEEDLFVFLHNIMQKRRKIMEKELLPLGMSHAEMRLLVLLYHADGCSQDELVSRLEVDRSNVGRALKKLEGMNYIVREKDENDHRAFRVFLTQGGWDVREDLSQIRNNLRKTFTRKMSARQLNDLAALLEKVDNSLSEENYLKIKQAR